MDFGLENARGAVMLMAWEPRRGMKRWGSRVEGVEVLENKSEVERWVDREMSTGEGEKGAGGWFDLR